MPTEKWQNGIKRQYNIKHTQIAQKYINKFQPHVLKKWVNKNNNQIPLKLGRLRINGTLTVLLE